MKWRITLTPSICLPGDDSVTTWSASGDVLTVEGEDYDFSDFPDGARALASDLGSQWIVGVLSRENDVMCVEIVDRLPFRPEGYDRKVEEFET